MKNKILIICIFVLLSGCFYKPEITDEYNDGSSLLDTSIDDKEESEDDISNIQDIGMQSDIIDIANKCKDNDSFYCSTEVKLGVPISDRISSKGEQNYYKIVIPTDGVLIIDIQPVPSNIDIEAKLYNSTQEQIWHKHNSYDYGKALITETNLKSGTYYLQVSDYGWNDSSSEFYLMKLYYKE